MRNPKSLPILHHDPNTYATSAAELVDVPCAADRLFEWYRWTGAARGCRAKTGFGCGVEAEEVWPR